MPTETFFGYINFPFTSPNVIFNNALEITVIFTDPNDGLITSDDEQPGDDADGFNDQTVTIIGPNGAMIATDVTFTYFGTGTTDRVDGFDREYGGIQLTTDAGEVIRIGYATDGLAAADPVVNGNTGLIYANLDSDDPTPLCFTAGSLILTEHGPKLVESLQVGDMVQTLDDGLQPVRWIGKRLIDKATLQSNLSLRPIRFKAHSLGIGAPEKDMWVSPQHRMLLDSWRCDLLFDETKVLSPAKFMTNDFSIMVDNDAESVEYIHILFDTHQIIKADGVWSESFHPGEVSISALDPATREELFVLFPELEANRDGFGSAALLSLKQHEVRALLSN